MLKKTVIVHEYLTIPNVLGIRIAKFISIGSLLLSTLIYSQNTHFGERFILYMINFSIYQYNNIRKIKIADYLFSY